MPTNIFGAEDISSTKSLRGEYDDGFDFKIEDLEQADDKQATPPSQKPLATQQTTKPPAKQQQLTPNEQDAAAEAEKLAKEKEKKESIDKGVNSFFGTDDKAKDPENEGDVEENKDAPDKEGDEVDDNEFSSLSKELYKLGVFKADVDEEGNEVIDVASSPEEFKALFEAQSNAKGSEWLENFLTRFGDDKKEFFEAVFMNGVDPSKYFAVSNSLEKMKGLDLTNEVNQERVVREFYKRSGMPLDKIDGMVKNMKDLANLQNQAETLHPLLIEQDEQSLLDEQEDAKQRLASEQRQDALYKQSITKILQDKIKDKDFDGIAVTPATAQKAFDFMYRKAWKTPSGQLLTEMDVWLKNLDRPENHALKAKLALLATNNLDLSKVKQKAVSTESNALFQSIKRKETKKAKPQQQEDNSWDSVLK